MEKRIAELEEEKKRADEAKKKLAVAPDFATKLVKQWTVADVGSWLESIDFGDCADSFKKGKPIIQTKQHLILIIEDLERDNLVMYASDDGNVVLI